MEDTEKKKLIKMIADYMENGYLESIITMFKSDRSLYSIVGSLITDERIRVRIGITALIEELIELRSEEVKQAIPSLKPVLKNENPVLRGDAAYLIGIIDDKQSTDILKPLLNDSNKHVVELVKDFIA